MHRPTLPAVATALALWTSHAHAQEQPLPPLPAPGTAPVTAPATGPATAPATATPSGTASATASGAAPVTGAGTATEPVIEPADAPDFAPSSSARGAYRHDGLYVRVAGGPGLLSLTGTGPTGGASIGGLSSGGTVAIGGTPWRGLVLGGAVTGVSVSGRDLSGAPAGQPHGWEGSAGSLSALVDWFPRDRQGWHIGAQLGIGFVELDYPAGQTTWTGGSLGGEAFGGYDFWIGPEWSLGLQAMVGFVGRAKLTDGSGNDSGYDLSAVDGGLEVTLLYH